MLWVNTELSQCQKGWCRVRPRMGCSKPSQLGLSPCTKLKDHSWTKHRWFISNLTLLFIMTWIKTATTECSQDWMPVVLSSVQTRAACSELRPWEMQIKLGVCCPTCAITASLEAVIKSWGEMDALRKIQGVRTLWLAHGWTCFKFNHISPFPLPANASPGSVLADPISFGRAHNLGWSSCIKLWVSLQHHLLVFKENSSEIRREGRRQGRQVIQPYKTPGLWFQPAFHAGAARGTWAVWLARASNQKVPQAYKVY